MLMKKWRVSTSDFLLFHQVSVKKICSDIKGCNRQYICKLRSFLVNAGNVMSTQCYNNYSFSRLDVLQSGKTYRQSIMFYLCKFLIFFHYALWIFSLLQFNLFSSSATFAEAVERFNSNIPYNGLLHAVTQDVSIQLFQERLLEKMCTRESRKVMWDMIDTLFLTTVSVEPTFVAFC